MKNKWNVALLLIFTFSSANADIIFVDLKRADSEVLVARQAAEKRGEKLYVIPPQYSAQDKVKIDKLEKEFESLKKQYLQYKGSGRELQDQVYEKEAELNEVRKKYYFHQDMLDKTISDIEKQGNLVSSLILSGHSMGESFWGPLGNTGTSNELHNRQVLEVFNKHPKSKTAMKSLYLWGCHSGELKPITWWGENFKDLKVIGGFSGTAPSSATASSPAILKDIMIKEAEISKLNDLKKVQAALNGLSHVHETPAVLMANSCYVGTSQSKVKAVKFDAKKVVNCDEGLKVLEPQLFIFQKYMSATEKNYTAVPKNQGSSPLRTFYGDLQQYFHCPQVVKKLQSTMGIPFNLDTVANLIHFDTIKRNFETFYRVKLGNDRASALKSIGQLPEGQRRVAEIMLKKMDCIPLTWVTEEPTPTSIQESLNTSCLGKYK